MKNQANIKSGILSEERRDFVKKSGTIAVMSMFGIGFFTACSKEEDVVNPENPVTPPASSEGITVNNSSVVIDLGKTTALNNTGGWLLIVSAQMLVVNTGNGFSALTSICTHSGCDRSWTFTNNQFECTCHSSRFTTSGEVVNGPANRPLRSFSNNLSGNTLTISRS
jgi:Rieske Fe-S protein